jgi:hypothetical protein
MDEKRLQELLEQSVVDCYDEEEEFGGVLCTLEDNLSFPLQAEAMGVPVEVLGLDSQRSSLRRGIVARVRKGDKEYTVGLSELAIIDPDPVSAEWVEMYRHWADEN